MLSLKSFSLLLTTLLATSSQALYFRLSPFTSTSIYSPTESHTITFTINNPDAVFEQGGSYPRTCNITCPDGMSPSYYARAIPSSASNNNNNKFSSEAFTLYVEEYYVYRNSARNNATIDVLEGQNAYGCLKGEDGQRTTCGFVDGTNSNLTAVYSVPGRDNVCAY
ncbi:hypothetical protein CERZMDRAFT_95522 [Cercospora zeae-maydis SCOH1-5]|uniref:AA1-like domain-containing protein n=1 Tax=Cercospora zeae-maydis SCOH1-5 TaxID=717836 RepID=A0A6A6FLB2_9PEZI|nr:hypothetical protein CERZMDRAFT_95522 [Cercospora zeae-maydis SCOH1-5]